MSEFLTLYASAPAWVRTLMSLAYAGVAAWAVWIVATRSTRRELHRKIDELLAVKRALEEANAQLELLSLADPLTGIPNRRKLDEELERLWAAASRDMGDLACLMIDIDHFKSYNDHYGHLEGDECLRRVAACLVASLERATDFVGRYGGEEFLVLLPRVDGLGARLVAERLRKAVERLHIVHVANRAIGVVTISVGVAAKVPRPDGDASVLVREADVALYLAKSRGRNRVAGFDAEEAAEPAAPDPA
ncbi:MAG: GGDEF domain-containing protein [Spirochaetales bacterium]|nr:GGDEF domain-containing protein [Spirochaetales bacterium]